MSQKCYVRKDLPDELRSAVNRQVCQDLDLRTDRNERRSFCIIHDPGNARRIEQFKAVVSERIASGQTDFYAAIVPTFSPFKKVQFTSRLQFNLAVFDCIIDSRDQTFDTEIDFSEAVFRSKVSFINAE